MKNIRTLAITLTAASFLAVLGNGCSRSMMSGPIAPEYGRQPQIIAAPTISCPGRTKKECLELEEMIRRTTASTVLIRAVRYNEDQGIHWGYGSGLVIDNQGTVLTAAHVIREAVLLTATWRELSKNGQLIEQGRTVQMQVIARNGRLDCALLKPVNKAERLPPPMAWLPGRPKARQPVFGFGHSSSWSEGRVLTPLTNMQYGKTIVHGLIKVKSLTRKGDSGGPLVDRLGRVRGILVLHKPGKRWSYYRPIDQALKAMEYTPPLE